MNEKTDTNKIDLLKAERFQKALHYLTYKGFIKNNEELSKRNILAYSNISRAKNGDLKYLTANMFERLCNEYNFFNLDFFLTGEGDMLKDGGGVSGVSVNNSGISHVSHSSNLRVDRVGAGQGAELDLLKKQLEEKDRQIGLLLEQQKKLIAKLTE